MEFLIVVDMQNDFLNGSLANYDSERVIKNVVEKINGFNGKRIYLTRDSHTKHYLKTSEGKYLPVEHCVIQSDGWQIENNIAKSIEQAKQRGVEIRYVDKPTFGSLALKDSLNSEIASNGESEHNTITLVGVCTDICVVSNALILKSDDRIRETSTIIVDEKCCSGISKESHDAAIITMKSCQIEII